MTYRDPGGPDRGRRRAILHSAAMEGFSEEQAFVFSLEVWEQLKKAGSVLIRRWYRSSQSIIGNEHHVSQEMERECLGMKKVKALTRQWVSLVRTEIPCVLLVFEILDFLQRIVDAWEAIRKLYLGKNIISCVKLKKKKSLSLFCGEERMLGCKWSSQSRGCHQSWGNGSAYSGGCSGHRKNSGITDTDFRKDFIRGYFTVLKGLSASPWVLPNFLFPPHHTDGVHLHITAQWSHTHPSLQSKRLLDTVKEQFPVITISTHCWPGTVSRNLGGLIHLIPATGQEDKYN